MDPTTAKVAKLLGQAMTRKGLTYRSLEEITFIPKSTIAQIIAGETSPRLHHLAKLADALDVSMTSLLTDAA